MAGLDAESVLELEGDVVASAQAPGGVELHRPALRVLAAAAAPPPVDLEASRHGLPAHGGFAIGLERWVARLVEAANIRETTLFPRDLTRLAP